MKLIIASNNAHKIYEIKTILSGKFDEILSLREAGISHETVEDGKTFMENAYKKAKEIAEIAGCAALADDSGITAHALGDKPGIYSARYASLDGENADDGANNALLLKNLSDKADKSAHYTAAISLVYPDGRRGLCIGDGTATCDKCGFCMSGEMASVFSFRPDTILAGLKLRG